MDGRGDRGEPIAIIGVACRFPGARNPAEFYELAVTGRRMFQPVRVLPGRSLRAATLDDWAVPQVTQGEWPSGGAGAGGRAGRDGGRAGADGCACGAGEDRVPAGVRAAGRGSLDD